MKKNNTAEKTVLEAEELSKALKESTEQSLKGMINEAIDNIVNDSDEPEDEDEDSYEVEDVDNEETPDGEANETPTEGDEESADADEADADEDEDWSDMEDYKIGDNDYDFTDAGEDDVLKVYNKLGDDDQILVKKDGEGKYDLKDEETGKEYVIELNADTLDSDVSDEEPETDFELEFDSEEPEDDTDDDLDIEISDDDEEDPYSDDLSDDNDIDIELDDDNEDEQLNEENLGYTDTYQKDVMPGLKMDEPADKSATYSMDAGAPKGNSRPYSGYKKENGAPFTKSVNECGATDESCDEEMVDEGAMTVSSQSVAKTTHTPTSEPRAEHKREVAKLTHNKGAYVNEAINKIIKKAKAIQAENKQYSEAINKIKKSLCEAAVLNVTLGQVVKLLSENTTSTEEKKSIVDRFNSVKTIKESKALYDTISRELNESAKKGVVLERTISTNDKTLNETTIYSNMKANNPSLDLMNRMENLYK